MEPVTLKTERLELSIPVEADVDAITEAVQDPEIPRWTTVASPYERTDAEGFIRSVDEGWASAGELVWAIRHEGRLAGMIGLHRVARGGAEIGYWMVADVRGRGLLGEAALAVVDWGFADLDLDRIEWRAGVGNVASARAARSLGFRYEGLLRKGLTHRAGRMDGWVAALLASDDRTPVPWPVLD